MDSNNLPQIILLFVALFLSALFSGAEAAYISMQKSKLAALMKNDPEKGSKVERFASNPEKLLSTVLTGNNLTNTAAAALGTGLALSYFSQGVAVVVSTIAVTILLLVFSEAIPKTIATRYSIGFASLAAMPLRIVEFVLLPLTWTLERFVRGITSIFGSNKNNIVSEEEIAALIELGRETGSVEDVQANMLDQVFKLGDRQMSEIMTPRTEIIAIEEGTNLVKFLDIYKQHRHSRFPVYQGNTDNILGILSVKDVTLAIAADEIPSDTSITRLKKPAFFLPETKSLREFFRQLETVKDSIFILIDEYGGVAGLATLKDLIAEVVGNIEDRSAENEEFRSIDANSYQVDGSLPIYEANEELHLSIPEGNYETVAGFVLARLGSIPKEGARVLHEECTFEVVKISGLRIDQIKVTRM